LPTPRLELLGGFGLTNELGARIDVQAKKNRALIGILALSPGHEATRDRVTGLLWSDRSEEQARSSLRQALVVLHRDFSQLETDPLISTGDRLAIDRRKIDIDVVEFLENATVKDIDSLRTAARLYSGPLLDGLEIADDAFEEWLREARRDLAVQATSVIEALTAKLAGSERISAGQKLVALDPLRESSQAALIDAYIAAGEKALAIRQYETCKLLLKRELGVEPGIELQKLHRSLVSIAHKPKEPTLVHKKPVIAVLPFEDLNSDPSQQYFSDGISQDIADRLTKFRVLSVIGHHSSFTFRDRHPLMSEIREKLKADYVVTGSIRKSDSRIVVAARLTDTETDTAVWADLYNRPVEDIFEIQDEVANIIASTLAGRLEIEITARAQNKQLSNFSSYEHILQGYWHFRKLTRAGNDQAMASFERAIELDPRNAEALSWLSWCYYSRWLYDFSGEDLKIGTRRSMEAIECDPANANCHLFHGFGQLWVAGANAAERSFNRAFALNPGDSNVLAHLSLLRTYQGRITEAKQWIEQAFKLNPLPPLWYPEFAAVTAIFEGRYEEALVPFEDIPDAAWDMMHALCCYGHLGLKDKARNCLARLQHERRQLDFIAGASAEPYLGPEPRERLIAGISKALAF
jgi:TolB-like protein